MRWLERNRPTCRPGAGSENSERMGFKAEDASRKKFAASICRHCVSNELTLMLQRRSPAISLCPNGEGPRRAQLAQARTLPTMHRRANFSIKLWLQVHLSNSQAQPWPQAVVQP